MYALPKVEKDLGMLKNETREGLENNLKGLRSDLEKVRKAAADLQANIEVGEGRHAGRVGQT